MRLAGREDAPGVVWVPAPMSPICPLFATLQGASVPITEKQQPAVPLAAPGPAASGRLAEAKETLAMLILTRKVDQGIVISGNILVRVLGVERDRVKIGISAPGEVTVLRQELWTEGSDVPFEKKPGNGNGAAQPPSAASA